MDYTHRSKHNPTAYLSMTGIGKLKSISECLKGVANGRPENKNLLVASGCFGMILMGFMSKNPPYNCKFKGARAHINNRK